MPEATAPDAPLERGELGPAIRRRTRAALAAGALEPISSETVTVAEAGIPFAVRVISGLARRRRVESAGDPPRDPFAPPDPALVVGAIGDHHLCVLNKYPVIDYHALIVTREFEDQETPLGCRDFAALWSCLVETDGLAFYNAGAAAGASQPHRHLQLVPTPLASPLHATPLDAVLEDARFDGGVGRLPALPFLHGLGRLRQLSARAPADAGATLLALYRELARAFACDRPGRPYNLLVCRDWMLFVPRLRADWQGIGVNALGFAGALMVPDRDSLERLRRAGVLRVLSAVAIATR